MVEVWSKVTHSNQIQLTRSAMVVKSASWEFDAGLGTPEKMVTPEEATKKAAATYNAAADSYDHPSNSFWTGMVVEPSTASGC